MKNEFEYMILNDDFDAEEISLSIESAKRLIDRDFDIAKSYMTLLVRDVFVKTLELSGHSIDYGRVNDFNYLYDAILSYFILNNLVFKWASSADEAYASSDLYIDSFIKNIDALIKANSEYKEVPDSEKPDFLEMMANIAGSICFSMYTSIVISRQNLKSKA